MPILDDVINFSCPAECGQLAVPCSLRMILNNEIFFCEACGFEFQPSEFPRWLPGASCARTDKDSAAKEMMCALYSYLYAGGPCPSESIISQLLKEDLTLWRLFPVSRIAISDIPALLDNEEFLAGLDFELLDGGKIAELLSLKPDFAAKCDLNKLTAANWIDLILKQPQLAGKCPWETLVSNIISQNVSVKITQKNSHKIFQYFPYKTDPRFQQKLCGSAETHSLPGSTGEFFAVVDFFDFYKHVDWKQFTPADLLSAAQKYHLILTHYPFDSSNLTNFDWNTFPLSEEMEFPAVLRPVFELQTGKRVVANLKNNPKLSSCCNWSKLKSRDWVDLLIAFPRESTYREHCDWRKLTEAAWYKILQDGKNTFAVAVYNALNGQKVLSLLKNHPEVKPYIAWEKIAVPDWFDLLAQDPRLAEHCPWEKVAQYIMHLPPENRQSIKSTHRRLWKKHTELIPFVDFTKLQTLSTGQYYAILDFFDWEDCFDYRSLSRSERIDLFVAHPQFAEKFGFENIPSEEKISMAIRSAEFCERYGWQNFTNEEISSVISSMPDFLPEFQKHCPAKKWRELVNSDEYIAGKYKLSFWDYLFFRKFTPVKLCSKISFVWHSLISLAGFSLFAYWQFDGPCGLKALSRQADAVIWLPVTVYILLAIIWSRIHARLFSGYVSFRYTVISAVSGVLLAAMQWYYTFFLSVISVENYICWGITLFVLFIMLGDRDKKLAPDFDNKKGLHFVLWFYLPAILATFLICQPFTGNQMRQLAEQLKSSSRPFYSAANYYQAKAADPFGLLKRKIKKAPVPVNSDAVKKARPASAAPAKPADAKAQPSDERKSAAPPIRVDNGIVRITPPASQKAAADLKDRQAHLRSIFTQKAIEAHQKKNYKQLVTYVYHADPDNKEIQFLRGKCSHLGLAKHKVDYSQAVLWYNKAVAQNHPGAMVNLGNLFLEGKGVAKNPAKAFELYRQAADQGGLIAVHNMGFCYYNGIGVKKDFQKAFQCFSKAAEQNYAPSQTELGRCYYYGHGVARDHEEALKWLHKADTQGNMKAKIYIGLYYFEDNGKKPDYQEAVKWFTPPAEEEYVAAQTGLGVCYFNMREYSKAVQWLTKAAFQNDSQAQTLLGICYFKGQGVPQDRREAVKWYRKGAMQGDTDAMNNLGICYLYGLGTEKNRSEALKWLREADKNGSKNAGKLLKELQK